MKQTKSMNRCSLLCHVIDAVGLKMVQKPAERLTFHSSLPPMSNSAHDYSYYSPHCSSEVDTSQQLVSPHTQEDDPQGISWAYDYPVQNTYGSVSYEYMRILSEYQHMLGHNITSEYDGDVLAAQMAAMNIDFVPVTRNIETYSPENHENYSSIFEDQFAGPEFVRDQAIVHSDWQTVRPCG
ncbi:hypothetical protein HYPSUDRAFT_582922 [Hypholoma sublateritium FD-334 SS-4]|uniref:Uncharacterized protein n=1 Tax=Hypholoma sublateritium (strain FD-334 SS-4) TaxID=945553 RepID=A0A0D2MIV5_HYPSF|nr:hypothetical protein HYPSUDRAFT_582922 [Hypholoma sublateritium FD-334 SS-4]